MARGAGLDACEHVLLVAEHGDHHDVGGHRDLPFTHLLIVVPAQRLLTRSSEEDRQRPSLTSARACSERVATVGTKSVSPMTPNGTCVSLDTACPSARSIGRSD